jgi:hypothetical protein
VPEPRRYTMQGESQYVPEPPSHPPSHRAYYERPAESSPPSSYRHYAHSEATHAPYAPAPQQVASWPQHDWRQASHRPYETSPQSAPDHYPPRGHQYPHHGAPPDASPWRAPAVPHHGPEYPAFADGPSDQQGAMGPPQHVEHGYHSSHRPPSQGPPRGSPHVAPPPPAGFPKMPARQVLEGANGSAREEDGAAEWREGGAGARPRPSPPMAHSPEEAMGGGAEQGFRAAGYAGYERREV